MDPFLFLSFLAATFLIVASPGPAVALASSQAVKHGPRAALTCVAGDALGTVVHIVIAVASLQALIGLASTLLPYLQIAGGGFILYLAVSSLRASTSTTSTPQSVPRGSVFLSGFFSCVTNPKAIVFFVALFPGFISPDHAILPQALIYGAVFIFLDAAAIIAYALLASYLLTTAIGPRVNIDRISGLGLLGVGLLLVGKGLRDLRAV